MTRSIYESNLHINKILFKKVSNYIIFDLFVHYKLSLELFSGNCIISERFFWHS